MKNKHNGIVICNHLNHDLKRHPQSIKEFKDRKIKKNFISFVDLSKYGMKKTLFLHIWANHICLSEIEKYGGKKIRVPMEYAIKCTRCEKNAQLFVKADPFCKECYKQLMRGGYILDYFLDEK